MQRYIYVRARPEPGNVSSLRRHTYRDLAVYIGYVYCTYSILQRAEHLLWVSFEDYMTGPVLYTFSKVQY